MGLEDELRRVRLKANAEAINRRHRRAQADALRLQQSMGRPASPSGLSPEFADQLAAAKKKAEAFEEGRAAALTPEQRIAELQLQGKLPPSVPTPVGYEPTAEEILGDLATSEPLSDPEQMETLPTADEVLSGAGDDSEPAPVMREQLNPELRGAIERAAVGTRTRSGNNHGRRSKR